MKFLFVAALTVASGTVVNAQDFVYRPTNPSFGGDSFNSNHLLGLADRQNRHQDDGSGGSSFSRGSSTDQFQRQIQSSLLSRVASQISERILGEEAQDSGRFSVGETVIAFQRVDGVVVIDITDGITGGTTSIEIPAPVF
jgi:curli production assembly/transport component CsgF